MYNSKKFRLICSPTHCNFSILFVVNPITSENNIMCTFMSGQTTYAFKGNFKHLTQKVKSRTRC